jgi:hypothetical protein
MTDCNTQKVTQVHFASWVANLGDANQIGPFRLLEQALQTYRLHGPALLAG